MRRYQTKPLALAAAVGGPAAFAYAAVAGARSVPGYRHRDEAISALAAKGSQAGPTMVAGFVGLAAGTAVLSRQLRGSALPKSVPSMMRAAAVTTALAGLARCSDRSCPSRFLGDDNATISDELHVVFSAATFVLWTAMPITTAIAGRELRRVDRVRSLALGGVAVAAWVATGVLVKRDAPRWGGAAQRVTVAAALGWFPVAAISRGGTASR